MTWLKNIFTFNRFNKKEEKNVFSIKEFDGKFGIVNRHGTLATGTTLYSRKRDAFRGADRRGLTLAA